MHCTGMKEKSLIILNRHSYPLYAGGSIKENFQDWDGKGSSVLLEARGVSTVFTIKNTREIFAGESAVARKQL